MQVAGGTLCSQIMKKLVRVARPEQSTLAAAETMLESRVGFLPICDTAGHPVGVVTDRDLTLRVCAKDLLASEVTLAEVMTKDPIRCTGQATVEHAQALMLEHQVRRVLVVDDDDHLVGLITLADLMQLLSPREHADWLVRANAMRFRPEI